MPSLTRRQLAHRQPAYSLIRYVLYTTRTCTRWLADGRHTPVREGSVSWVEARPAAPFGELNEQGTDSEATVKVSCCSGRAGKV